MLKNYFIRHQPAKDPGMWLKSGIGATFAMGLLGWLALVSGVPWLFAPFGASCVLIFSVPESPLSQPMNVVGGHMVASALALALHTVFPGEWWAIALAVGASITVMAALRITHPPAGADPVVIFLADPNWWFLIMPILTGALILIVVATVVHKFPPKILYPTASKNLSTASKK